MWKTLKENMLCTICAPGKQVAFYFHQLETPKNCNPVALNKCTNSYVFQVFHTCMESRHPLNIKSIDWIYPLGEEIASEKSTEFCGTKETVSDFGHLQVEIVAKYPPKWSWRYELMIRVEPVWSKREYRCEKKSSGIHAAWVWSSAPADLSRICWRHWSLHVVPRVSSASRIGPIHSRRPANKLYSLSAMHTSYTGRKSVYRWRGACFFNIRRQDIPGKFKTERSAIYCELGDSLLPPVARNRKVHWTKVYFWDLLLMFPFPGCQKTTRMFTFFVDEPNVNLHSPLLLM